jgi:hypothetical protein
MLIFVLAYVHFPLIRYIDEKIKHSLQKKSNIPDRHFGNYILNFVLNSLISPAIQLPILQSTALNMAISKDINILTSTSAQKEEE